LHAAGESAAALDAYARIRRRLADDLGIDPGPALLRLHRAVLRGETIRYATAPTADALPATPLARAGHL
jgi:DNA-binding SARP family transcriptional activator